MFWKFIQTIFTALFNSLFSWGQKQAEKPNEIEDANTPKDIKSDWNDYITGKLRDKKDNSNR